MQMPGGAFCVLFAGTARLATHLLLTLYDSLAERLLGTETCKACSGCEACSIDIALIVEANDDTALSELIACAYDILGMLWEYGGEE